MNIALIRLLKAQGLITSPAYILMEAGDKFQHSDLTHQSAKRADRMPMLGEMMKKLHTSAPVEATGPLDEFREYSWKSLSSYVHGGIHAIDRHSKGYPEGILEQALRASNGLCGVVGMFAAVLTSDQLEVSEMSKLYSEYSDCVPMIRGAGET